jgi:hypothetical protein
MKRGLKSNNQIVNLLEHRKKPLITVLVGNVFCEVFLFVVWNGMTF